MLITMIISLYKNKSKVFINENFAFVLHNSELKKYSISENMEISEDIYNQIIEKVLKPRVKNRALYIIERNSKTEYEIREKLRKNEYTELLIDYAVEYLKSYKYIDDETYVKRYIEVRNNKYSINKLMYDLIKKGISKDLIKQCIEEQEELTVYSERAKIKVFILKKYPDLEKTSITREEKYKLFCAIIRKGYTADDINAVFNEIMQ